MVMVSSWFNKRLMLIVLTIFAVAGIVYSETGSNWVRPIGTGGGNGTIGPPGPQGPPGINGSDGYTPIKGVDYFDGLNGTDGANGTQGPQGPPGAIGPAGPQGLNGSNGLDGLNGSNGINGSDGYTPIKGVDYFDGLNGTNGLNGTDGINGTNGLNGANGTTYTTVGPYLYNDSTAIYFNESRLNSTVLDLFGIHEENVSVIVVGGTGTVTTTTCCGPRGEVLQLAVFPTTQSNTYRFEAHTTLGSESVDSDRMAHTGNWTVAHRGSVVMADTITYTITNAQVDETFRVRVRWRAG